jgi:RNA polymerase sigma-70 factor (ECF subfamily)
MSPEDTFEQHRSLLFSIAYRMLGSAMEAEDMVQETYLRFMGVDPESIRSPRSFLCTVITRLCLDYLKSAKTQREAYIGPWLPEPMLTEGPLAPADEDTPDHLISRYEDISLAFLTVLESLSPVERAVFLLREVFDYDYDEIAAVVEKSPANCRQLYSRARQHIDDGKARFSPPPEKQERMLAQFFSAISSGDVNGLQSMLAQDAMLWSDGGGKIAAATRPLSGAETIARFMIGINQKAPDGVTRTFNQVNGAPAAVVWHEGQIRVVVTFSADDDHILALRLIGNPDKLRYLQRQLTDG